MSEFKYRFMVTTPLEVEETLGGGIKKKLKGVFLRLGTPTGNGREYQTDEGSEIAGKLIGMPVFYGAKIGFDPTLLKMGWKHLKDTSDKIGRVVQAAYNKTRKVIEGIIEIWNTEKNPTIAEEAGPGWGLSIGGEVNKFTPVGKINKFGNPIVKAIGMIANHLQLLRPNTPRGQQDARTTDEIPVEETLMFDPCPWGEMTVTPDGIMMCSIDGTSVTVPVEESGIIEDPPKRMIKKIIRKIYINEDPDSILILDE